MDRMEKEPLIQEGRRLPDVADVNGLVSFMGRLMDGQESFYLDLLLASLVRLHPFIKPDDAERMMPVFRMGRNCNGDAGKRDRRVGYAYRLFSA